ncbi:hypothetical protein QQ045_019775 [Rhodiola kirilowii]
MFHKGQVVNAAQSNEAGVAARTTITASTAPSNEARVLARTTTTVSGVAMQRVVLTCQHSLSLNDINSTRSESQRSGEEIQSSNKAVSQTGMTVPSQQTSDVGKGSNAPSKKSVEVEMKQMVDSSSINCKDSEIFPTSDDEDVCPTCLEEYTEENPKITTRCDHHFHLPCIFEWMQRSNSCPVCDKFMEFDEMI